MQNSGKKSQVNRLCNSVGRNKAPFLVNKERYANVVKMGTKICARYYNAIKQAMKSFFCIVVITMVFNACSSSVRKPDAGQAKSGNEQALNEPVEKPDTAGSKKEESKLEFNRVLLTGHINKYYAEQLTNPQKKSRKSLSQFGYNLELIPFPMFPITEFIDPDDFGRQSYGKGGPGEHNGSLYTCRGGFMDFSHIRCAADWTVYLTFKIITEQHDFDLPPEAGTLKLRFQNLDKLSLDDVGSLAQKITVERLVWHEVASWHYHSPNYEFSEQQSTFTPEDLYSNILGTVIGKKIAMRILKNLDTLSYSEIASEEIAKEIASLNPVKTKKESKEAYDIVDRYKQLKLPVAKRNKDVWWDSNIVFSDERYCFKRYMNIGPQMPPWLVPESQQLGCPVHPKAEVLPVPQKASTGESFYSYYQFTISPDSVLFFAKKSHKQLHPVFMPFSTQHFDIVVNQIGKEMEEQLLAGYDKRDNDDPVAQFKGIKRVLFE